jgi:hypothetical protein
MADLKEEFEKLKLEEIKGEVIGLALENHFNFILEQEGKEGVKKVEEGFKKLGYPLRHEEIENFKWGGKKILKKLLLNNFLTTWKIWQST